jgi:acetolactate synthase-1/2/3 large subunit
MTDAKKYSDILCEYLRDLGYTHCFSLAGGNIMHLQESVSRYFTLVPVVHEVAAGIAAEYFTESGLSGKAFALVTAGPGLTNIVSAIAGAFLESRELLVIGGQVKTADLSHGQVRQRGIQEIDGVSLVRSITKHAVRFDAPWSEAQFKTIVRDGFTGKKGPVFLEMPLDMQARMFTGPVPDAATGTIHIPTLPAPDIDAQAAQFADRTRAAKRPVLLLGGGVSRAIAAQLHTALEAWGVPIATTWNGADRFPADSPLYIGRPNTWGQRYANLLLQQSDLLLAVGTRLGMQQTGFNWQQFAPLAEVVQVDIDPAELAKGHPRTAHTIAADANLLLPALLRHKVGDYGEWLAFCHEVKAALPLIEPAAAIGKDFVSPYHFCAYLATQATADDLVVPCSSGSAFTVMMQTFAQKMGQVVITNKGSASMGYGLSGAIGLALAGGGRRTILVEGDGGFAQNIQEIGTVAVNKLPLKMFIFDDHGYASIRMTQRNYFGGKYLGCDIETGLGLPNWEKLLAAYDMPTLRLTTDYQNDPAFHTLFNAPGPAAFLVPIDPLQTYFPKITSRVLPGGGMESNPLHWMSPPLEDTVYRNVAKYLPDQPI